MKNNNLKNIKKLFHKEIKPINKLFNKFHSIAI